MRQRLLLAALGLTVLFAAFTVFRRPSSATMPHYTERRPRRAAAAAAATGPVGETARESSLHRNPFEFGGGVAPSRTPVALPARTRGTPPPPPAPTPETKVKLVGMVHRGKGERAALNVEGTITVLAAGESAEGYTVLTIDAEAGVRVRTPDGREVVLLPPPR